MENPKKIAILCKILYNIFIGDDFMGFFDIFKKNDKQNIGNVVNNRQPLEQLLFDIEYSPTSNGNLQVDRKSVV